MIAEQRYYGQYNNRWMIGIFLYSYQAGEGTFAEDQIILFDESNGESVWIELGHFLNHFRRMAVLDTYLLNGYSVTYEC